METLGKEIRIQLEDKVRILGQFSDATDQMCQSLEAHDIKRVALSVERRGRAIERINQIDRELARLIGSEGWTIDDLPADATELILPCLEEVGHALKKLTEANIDCLALAQSEYDSRKESLLKIRRGIGVAKGYRIAGDRVPKFLDIKN